MAIADSLFLILFQFWQVVSAASLQCVLNFCKSGHHTVKLNLQFNKTFTLGTHIFLTAECTKLYHIWQGH